jgi:hypothetical protein
MLAFSVGRVYVTRTLRSIFGCAVGRQVSPPDDRTCTLVRHPLLSRPTTSSYSSSDHTSLSFPPHARAFRPSKSTLCYYTLRLRPDIPWTRVSPTTNFHAVSGPITRVYLDYGRSLIYLVVVAPIIPWASGQSSMGEQELNPIQGLVRPLALVHSQKARTDAHSVRSCLRCSSLCILDQT